MKNRLPTQLNTSLISSLDLDGIALLEEILALMLSIKPKDIFSLTIRNYLFCYGKLDEASLI